MSDLFKDSDKIISLYTVRIADERYTFRLDEFLDPKWPVSLIFDVVVPESIRIDFHNFQSPIHPHMFSTGNANFRFLSSGVRKVPEFFSIRLKNYVNFFREFRRSPSNACEID